MSDWPVGVSTGCFYYRSIFDCLTDVREGGFCMVEICSSPLHLDFHDLASVERAERMLGELGMEAYSFHAPFAPHIDITALDGDQRRRSLEEILVAVEAAARLGVRYLIIHPGPERAFEPSPEERLRRLQYAGEVLEQICQRCQDRHVGLVLENMLPHLLFGNTRDMLWILGAIRHVNVGTCLDTGHAHLSGDLYRVLYKLSGHLAVIHANDNLGSGDDHLPPGDGHIDWRRLLTELGDVGFDGGIVLELNGDPRRSPQETLAQARRARSHLRNISRDLALSSPQTVRGPNLPSRE